MVLYTDTVEQLKANCVKIRDLADGLDRPSLVVLTEIGSVLMKELATNHMDLLVYLDSLIVNKFKAYPDIAKSLVSMTDKVLELVLSIAQHRSTDSGLSDAVEYSDSIYKELSSILSKIIPSTYILGEDNICNIKYAEQQRDSHNEHVVQLSDAYKELDEVTSAA